MSGEQNQRWSLIVIHVDNRFLFIPNLNSFKNLNLYILTQYRAINYLRDILAISFRNRCCRWRNALLYRYLQKKL